MRDLRGPPLGRAAAKRSPTGHVVVSAGPAHVSTCPNHVSGASASRVPLRSYDDPEATLLVQVQGVIAEYERAKIAERNRRGRLFRARAGEIVYRLVPFGYRRRAGERA